MEDHPTSLNHKNSSSSALDQAQAANNLEPSPDALAQTTGNLANSDLNQHNQLANNSRTIPASEVQLQLTPDLSSEESILLEHNKNHQIVQSLLQEHGDESKPILDSFANANLSFHSDIPVPTLYVSNTSSSSHHLTQTKPKANNTKPIKVVNAAIALLYNEFGQVFVSQRRAGCDYEHSLEFPGGKIELGETPEQCVIRELEEEIGIDVLNMEKLCVFIWRTLDREHIVHIYKVTDYIGEPYGKEGQEIFWFNVDELDDNRFMPASQDLISCIRNTEIDLHK